MSDPYRLTINLAALARNWQRLADMAPTARCAAVVKANAYGLGLERIVPALGAAGCTDFFVATPQEGSRVRARDARSSIYILDGLIGDPAHYHQHGLKPVIGTMAEWKEWQATPAHNRSKAALHVDTGMNRLGLTLEEAHRFPRDTAASELDLIISHLACADTPSHPLNETQRRRFGEVRMLFPDVPASLCNSAGIFLGTPYHYEMVRPGIALYGGDSHPEANMEMVVTAEAQIIQLRTVAAGESIGYGAVHRVEQESQIAILAAGYADGIHRLAGHNEKQPNAEISLKGHKAPIVGRISMDLIAVDVTGLPPGTARRGDYAELFGSAISIDEAAGHAETIGYELLTGLSRRAERIYTN